MIKKHRADLERINEHEEYRDAQSDMSDHDEEYEYANSDMSGDDETQTNTEVSAQQDFISDVIPETPLTE